MLMSYDLIIIGAGPAGLAAAIYAKRGGFAKILIFEKSSPGGKLNKTAEVDNYPGFTSVKGPKLAEKMTKHVQYYEIEWKYEEILKLEKREEKFFLQSNTDQEFISKAVIIASGAVENELKIPGEKALTNLGVSYCAICDGFLFREKIVVVVGGGYSALETALYMSNIANRVYLIHRRDNFRAEKEIIIKVQNNPKIIILLNSVLSKINGENKVTGASIRNLVDNQTSELSAEAIFPCVGLAPFSNFTHKLGVCDQQNYINIKNDCSTSISGLFAAGDVARVNECKIRQIVTAVAEGAIAAQSAIKYLEKT